MDNYFVTKEIAEELRLLNYADSCIRGFNSDGLIVGSLWGVNFNGMNGYTSQPTYFQVIDWAREQYDVFACLTPSYIDENKPFSFIVNRVSFVEQGYEERWQAYHVCTLEVLELIKLKNESKSNSNTGLGEQEDS